MKLTQRGSNFYLVKRVPDRFSCIEKRKQIWVSLRTDSHTEAKKRAYDVVRDLENQWIATLANKDNHFSRFDALSALAASRGFPYLPASDVANLPLQEILTRASYAQESKSVADAMLGAVESPKPTGTFLTEIKDIYFDLVSVEIKEKSRDQKRIWKNTASRALKHFISAVGNKEIEKLTREDILLYRSSWVTRIENETASPASANREFAAISGIFSKLNKLKGLSDPALFRNLNFSNLKKRRPPYEENYIKEFVLPALENYKLNQQAADILRILINTGMRPSEVTGLDPADIYIEEDIPYISIRPRPGRELKTQTSIRDIPLVGIALEAIKRHPRGFERYAHSSSTLGQIVNKFLKVHDLRPTPEHCVYSFRHGFQDRLTAVEAPDRIQADLMGHRYVRERYGRGPALAQKAQWLSKIGFF